MEEPRLSEKEALGIIASVFDQNMRRMNFIRGELFIVWGAILTLTALLEYGLFRWTGDLHVLWSWFVPLIGGYIWTIYNTRRLTIIRTGFDNLLILIWGIPAMLAAACIVYAVAMPANTMNPVGITQLLLGAAVLITAEFFRGKGSQQSGSFVSLQGAGIFGIIWAFNWTFRQPFDPVSGNWMLELAGCGVLLLILPGFILRHITNKQCSKN